jgi:hypothetical protein
MHKAAGCEPVIASAGIRRLSAPVPLPSGSKPDLLAPSLAKLMYDTVQTRKLYPPDRSEIHPPDRSESFTLPHSYTPSPSIKATTFLPKPQPPCRQLAPSESLVDPGSAHTRH